MENKIEVEDLRVGNWVSIHHLTQPAEIIQITADWLLSIENINKGITKSDSPLFRIVEPIPITISFIERNFVYAVYNGYGYYSLNEQFCLRFQDKYLYLCLWDDGFEYAPYAVPKYICKVNNIHHLQNILQDIGIKKEIIL